MRQRCYRSFACTGFTLVEMAMVITIVALIVGAVIGGQRAIRNSEISSLMAEAKSYQSAFAIFQERYTAIPGDFATASSIWPTASNGDGNNLIRAGTNNLNEAFIAFQHLALAGLIAGNYAGTGTTGTAGVNIPRAVITTAAYEFDHPLAADGVVTTAQGDTYFFDGVYPHVLIVGGVNPGAGWYRPLGGFLTPEEMLSLDQKHDDGVPSSGAILTPKAASVANCASGSTAPATYVTTGNDKTCMFMIKQP